MPERPRGYRWLLSLPAGYTTGDFWQAVNGDLVASERSVYPADVRPQAQETLTPIYRRSRTGS